MSCHTHTIDPKYDIIWDPMKVEIKPYWTWIRMTNNTALKLQSCRRLFEAPESCQSWLFLALFEFYHSRLYFVEIYEIANFTPGGFWSARHLPVFSNPVCFLIRKNIQHLNKEVTLVCRSHWKGQQRRVYLRLWEVLFGPSGFGMSPHLWAAWIARS